MKTLRLGLIGGNITETRSVALHVVCGLSAGLNVTYDLLIPDEQGIRFEAMLERCKVAGFDGVNVTYPYKEVVLKFITPSSAAVAALGASNTVKFSADEALAWNTDYTGFISAYRAKWGATNPGRVLIIGAGGVGRAIGFALKDLDVSEILIYDTDTLKASALAASLGAIHVSDHPINLSLVDGVVNCTPLGMTGREGSPLPQVYFGRPRWAFDAVYTPEHTVFRSQIEAVGAEFLSGYELYFHQGIQAFKIFSGIEVTDLDWVRQTLLRKSPPSR